MTDEDDRPLVRLADTRATIEDEDGTTRARMEALSKGGESRSADEYEALVGSSDESEE